MANEVKIIGEHGDAILEGKALILAVLVYYPDKDQIVTVALDHIPKEETLAIMAKFPHFHLGPENG